jgi:uncharacterized protein YjiS (DUF1127 family)
MHRSVGYRGTAKRRIAHALGPHHKTRGHNCAAPARFVIDAPGNFAHPTPRCPDFGTRTKAAFPRDLRLIYPTHRREHAAPMQARTGNTRMLTNADLAALAAIALGTRSSALPTCADAPSARHGLAARARAHVVAAWRVVLEWRRRARSRAQLRSLSPGLIQDFCLDSMEAEREAQKPFWRA